MYCCSLNSLYLFILYSIVIFLKLGRVLYRRTNPVYSVSHGYAQLRTVYIYYARWSFFLLAFRSHFCCFIFFEVVMVVPRQKISRKLMCGTGPMYLVLVLYCSSEQARRHIQDTTRPRSHWCPSKKRDKVALILSVLPWWGE